MPTQFKTGLVWFRRDLRLHDNTALHAALQQCERVVCAFVFDQNILAPLPRTDRRVEFIRESLVELQKNLAGRLVVLQGRPQTCIPALVQELGVQAVFAGRDYEPHAVARDVEVRESLRALNATLVLVKDHVIFEEREVLTQMAKPYGVFTPYKRAWLARLEQAPLTQHDSTARLDKLIAKPRSHAQTVPTLAELGFLPTNLQQLSIPTGESGAQQLLGNFVDRMGRYDQTRDFPALKGPSYLSVHLRFGTVSIRQLVALAQAQCAQGSPGADIWLGELVWRDFYFQILANFPQVASHAFKPEYDHIAWEQGEHALALYTAWCQGKTGYPLVDAAMAQLNQTGYMHNRLRMVTGSFLVKHLGLDWRWGERYFAEQLNDFDLSANNGGWQWVSSSGCDAQPYFRIFNPITQSERFDAEGKFIRRYLPALAGLSSKSIHAPWLAKTLELSAAGITLGESYPLPIVDHATARARTLQRYGIVKKADSDR